MKASDLFVKCLEEEGVTRIFGVPGEENADFMISLKKSKKSGKTSSIIVVAEGDKTGKNVFELASKIEETLPKYETRVSVLGHIQRGGTPSCFDRVLGTQLGVKAVESLIDGNDGNMVGIDNGKIIFTPLRKALKGKTKINK